MIIGLKPLSFIQSNIHYGFNIFKYSIIMYSCIRINLDGFDRPLLCFSSWCRLVVCETYTQQIEFSLNIQLKQDRAPGSFAALSKCTQLTPPFYKQQAGPLLIKWHVFGMRNYLNGDGRSKLCYGLCNALWTANW